MVRVDTPSSLKHSFALKRMQFEARDFRRALEAKGFRHDRSTGDDVYYFYNAAGQKTSIHTKVSKGRGETLRDVILGKIKRQMKLESGVQLADFIRCRMTEEGYSQFLHDTYGADNI